MNTKAITFFLFFISVGAGSCQAATITFDNMEANGRRGIYYGDQGFLIEARDSAGAQAALRTSNSSRPDTNPSPTVASLQDPSFFKMTSEKGKSFSAYSIDIGKNQDIPDNSTAEILFSAKRVGGGTAFFTILLDQSSNILRTFYFPPEFSDITSLSWNSGTVPYQFDNIMANQRPALEPRDLNNDGNVDAYYDANLDISWLADANIAKTSGYHPTGTLDIIHARTWVAGLSIHGVTGWRLPRIRPVNGLDWNFVNFTYNGITDYSINLASRSSELAFMYFINLGKKSHHDFNGNFISDFGALGLGNSIPGDWGSPTPTGQADINGISNIQNDWYWIGTEPTPYTDSSSHPHFGFQFGRQALGTTADFKYVWPVHDGDVGEQRLPLIVTSAGSGVTGFSGDGGLAVAAEMMEPTDVSLDTIGNLYISDPRDHRIRKVEKSTGIITTIAGTGRCEFSGDGGPAVAAGICNAYRTAIAPNGDIYIADTGNSRIRRITAENGIIETVAGNGNHAFSGDLGPAQNAELKYPYGVALDDSGNIYIADSGNYRVRKVDGNSNIITTIAGNGYPGIGGDGMLATKANLNTALGVAVDFNGNIYISDHDNWRIRVVSKRTGKIDTLIATANRIIGPDGLSFDKFGNLYIAGRYNQRVFKYNFSSQELTTVAGGGAGPLSGDFGPPLSAFMAGPNGVAVDSDGNIYIAERSNSRVRKVYLADSLNNPVISSTVTGETINDWFVGNVQLVWHVTQAGDTPLASSSGCGPVLVTSDTLSTTFTCSASNIAGGTTTKSVTIKRDATPPVATATPSPLPNSAGWHNGSVRILFSGTDATSGVASCSTADLVATEGAAQTSAAGTCTDNAGNVSAPVTFSPINIDLTPPSVRGIPSPASNAADWNNTPVTVSYAGEDTLSGVAADGCSAPQTLTASGAGQSATGTCADRAGNGASVTVSGINIDTVAPVAYALVSPAANAANWHKSPVTVSFTGTDSISGSGIAACSGNANVTADGGGQTRSGTCGDIAGNTSASAIATVNLDQTVPVVSITSPTSGGSYTQGSTLTAAFSCTDATSGINGCVGSVNSGQPISTATLGQMGFAAAATDFAGNSTLQTVYYTVTAPAPAFTLAPNSLAFGSQALNTAIGLVVSIRNAGGTTLTLGTTSITGTHANQFTRTSACGTTLAAGGSCNFSITFKPTSAGNKVATFSVTTSTAGTKTVALSGTGVAAAYTLSPTALTFPSTTRNTTSASQRVTVTNTSTVAMPITSITLGGTNANQFVKTQTCGVSLAANSSCYVDVAFKPTTSGSKSATLAVTPGGGAMVKNVSLKGNGL